MDAIHATAVAYAGVGCLLMGPSGTGKSRLASDMMLLGARLVADDRVVLSVQSGMLMGGAPPQLAGILELTNMGIIRINDVIPRHVLHLVVELTPGVTERLPTPEPREFLGLKLPAIRVPPAPQTSASALMLYLKAMQEGRILPPDWRPPA